MSTWLKNSVITLPFLAFMASSLGADTVKSELLTKPIAEQNRKELFNQIKKDPQQLLQLVQSTQSYSELDMRVLLDVLYRLDDTVRASIGQLLLSSKDPVARYGAYQLLQSAASEHEALYSAYCAAIIKASLNETNASNLVAILSLLQVRDLPEPVIAPARLRAEQLLSHSAAHVRAEALGLLLRYDESDAMQGQLVLHLAATDPSLFNAALEQSYTIQKPSQKLLATLQQLSQEKEKDRSERAQALLMFYQDPNH